MQSTETADVNQSENENGNGNARLPSRSASPLLPAKAETRSATTASSWKKFIGTLKNRWLGWKKPWKSWREERLTRVPRKELPAPLKTTRLGLQFLVQIAIIMVIAGLWIVSTHNQGIASVPDIPTRFFPGFGDTSGSQDVLLWTYALLWTTVPVWIMNLYAAFYKSMLDSLKACQPVMELLKGPEHSTAKRTILLDYNEYLPIINSFHALSNRHFLVATCMLVHVSLILASALSATILTVESVSINGTVPIVCNSYFDKYTDSASKSSAPALGIVSANLINGGQPFPWTTQNYSVLPYYSPAGSAVGNLTGDTSAYSSTLECVSFTADELVREGAVTLPDGPTDPEANNETTVEFKFTDRGCSIDKSIVTFSTQLTYGQTWAVTRCPLAADRARFGVILGEYDASQPFLLSNFTLLSCIPYFWNSKASATVRLSDNSSSEIIGLSISNPMKWWPEFWQVWLENMPYYHVFDPIQETAGDMDSLATLASNYGAKYNTSFTYPFDTQAIAASFPIVYSAVFAAFASTSAYTSMPQTQNFPGTLLRPQNRLVVVWQVGTVVILIVAVALLTTLWVAVYVSKNREDLSKNQNLILGHAILVHESPEILDYINLMRGDVRQQIIDNDQSTGGTRNSAMRGAATVGTTDLVKYVANSASLSKSASLRNRESLSTRASLSRWNCWLDDKGKMHLAPPVGVTAPPGATV